MKQTRDSALSAFTMVEAMITIGLVSILGALALLISGNVKGKVEFAKLEQDVKTVNAAAKLFIANGGSFEGLSDPQAVLDRMKTAQAHAKQKQFVGMTGATLDKRLGVRPLREDRRGLAAVWDAASNQFVIQKDARAGVATFLLDEALAEIDYAPRERDDSALVYDENPGWIWKYEEAAPNVQEGPTVIPTSLTPDTAPPALPVMLLKPVIVLSSNAFNDSTPEISVRIDNPNPSGSSAVYFSIVPVGGSHGPLDSWGAYNGAFPTQSADYPDGFEVVAYAKSTDSGFLDSDSSSAETISEFFGIPTQGNVLYIVDASSSMGRSLGSKSRFEATIDELISAIEGLPGSIKFNVAMFDQSVHWTDGTFKLHPANQLFKARLISQVRRLDYDEGTNYAAGLSLPPRYDPVPDQVVFLSDGEPNNNDFLDELAVLVSLGVRVDTIGLNSSNVGRSVLQLIASETGGGTTFVD